MSRRGTCPRCRRVTQLLPNSFCQRCDLKLLPDQRYAILAIASRMTNVRLTLGKIEQNALAFDRWRREHDSLHRRFAIRTMPDQARRETIARCIANMKSIAGERLPLTRRLVRQMAEVDRLRRQYRITQKLYTL